MGTLSGPNKPLEAGVIMFAFVTSCGRSTTGELISAHAADADLHFHLS